MLWVPRKSQLKWTTSPYWLQRKILTFLRTRRTTGYKLSADFRTFFLSPGGKISLYLEWIFWKIAWILVAWDALKPADSLERWHNRDHLNDSEGSLEQKKSLNISPRELRVVVHTQWLYISQNPAECGKVKCHVMRPLDGNSNSTSSLVCATLLETGNKKIQLWVFR